MGKYRKEIVSFLRRLESNGAEILNVDDGEEIHWPRTVKSAADVIDSVDDSRVTIRWPAGTATFAIVLGNEPGYLISDYGVSLPGDEFVDGIVDAHCDEWDT